jgi:hypothetical protein
MFVLRSYIGHYQGRGTLGGYHMSVVAAPAFPATRLANLVLALLLFLGLSFAVVSEMTVKCEPVYLTLDGKIQTLHGELLTLGEQRCQAVAGEFSVPLPAWLSSVLW